MNFRNPKIASGLAFHRLELLTSDGLSPQNSPLRSVRFPLVVSVCSNTFLVQAVSRIPEKPPFWSWLCLRQKLPECFTTAESLTQTFIGLSSTARSSVVYNWTQATFQVLQQETHLSLTNRAMHLCKCNGVADLLKHAPPYDPICITMPNLVVMR